MKQIVLYSRPRCHLCDAAREALTSAGFAFREVDVDGEPALAAEYGTTIPVVEVGGIPVFEGGMDPSGLAPAVLECL
ncbi:MAG: glutaredoxin family protein [Actinomycetota bacterium]